MDGIIELLLITKTGGSLTKQVWLDNKGKKHVDSRNCFMTEGKAQLAEIRNAGELARLVVSIRPNEALCLGTLLGYRDAEQVIITTKSKLNGAHYHGVITRSLDFIRYESKQPAFALLDHDTKGMTDEVFDKLEQLGGFEAAITTLIPEIADTMRVMRASTSAGLYNSDTGEELSNGGVHAYIAVRNGDDIKRFLDTLHDWCWLKGLGWFVVGTAGQLLDRSIIDKAVASPERLVFEAAPELTSPLMQDVEKRRPIWTEGTLLDTKAACPSLSPLERYNLETLKSKAKAALKPQQEVARAKWTDKQVDKLVRRKGLDHQQAKRVVDRWFEGVLLPDIQLEFDDPELAGTTVADILADPEKYVGETLADPLEGIAYGRGKAKVLRRPDGSIMIHSFAHGHISYDLRLDSRAVEALLQEAPDAGLEAFYIELVLTAELSEVEVEKLRNMVHDRTGAGKRILNAELKAARDQQNRQRQQQTREQRQAERQNSRPQFEAPAPDAEWLPVVEAVTEVLLASQLPEPPMRDPDGFAVRVWSRRVSRLRLLSAAGANSEAEATPLPAPEQTLISRLKEPALAELIERHVEFIALGRDGDERPVHLDPKFVRHLVQRDDDLPIVTAVATLPVVLDDGRILAKNGLDRDHDTVFRIPDQLLRLVQRNSIPDESEIAVAMEFLVEEWLVDVTTDFAGKCIIISCALTVIERVVLGERPAYFVSAGMRGGGKTTVLNMVSLAVLGQRAAATAWSSQEEERRKALFSYLLEGVAFLVWDNIAKGSLISCPHIEKALTSETFADRVLGQSRSMAPFASTVQAFTGNNIGPRGDLTSRSLNVRLAVSRPDPENRDFVHPDPVGWTRAYRGKILAALFTILTGNPRRRQSISERTPAPTRFKPWWDMVGSAVEHAADLYQRKAGDKNAVAFRFEKQFLTGEQEDENAVALVRVLTDLNARWPGGERFEARDVVSKFDDDSDFKRSLEVAAGNKPIKDFTPNIVGWRLKAMRDAPAMIGVKDGLKDDQVIATLRWLSPGAHRNDAAKFWIEVKEVT